MTFTTIRMLCVAMAFAAALAPKPSHSATYPTRPIELVVPYAPGGASDIVARELAPYLQQELGASVVVTNKAGANTAIAAAYLARSPNDGYTLMLADVALLLNAAIHPGAAGYDAEKDFAPIGMVGSAPFVLYVPATGAKTLAEFLQKGKQKGVTIANAGPGSLGHLAAELLQLKTSTSIVSVPYRGSGPALNETMGGQVDATFGSTASGMPQVQSGRLRVLAVASPTPIEDYPEIPTFSKLGIDGVYALNWWGVIGPAGIDPAIVNRVYQALQKIVALPAVKERFVALGVTRSLRTPAEYSKVMKADLALWSGVVRDAKIKID